MPFAHWLPRGAARPDSARARLRRRARAARAEGARVALSLQRPCTQQRDDADCGRASVSSDAGSTAPPAQGRARSGRCTCWSSGSRCTTSSCRSSSAPAFAARALSASRPGRTCCSSARSPSPCGRRRGLPFELRTRRLARARVRRLRRRLRADPAVRRSAAARRTRACSTARGTTCSRSLAYFLGRGARADAGGARRGSAGPCWPPRPASPRTGCSTSTSCRSRGGVTSAGLVRATSSV